MSWRTVVVSSNAKLDYQIGYMVVRGEKTTKIHLNEIGMLIVESTAVSMTSYLLSELMKNKIKVVFCDEKRNPCSELVSYYGSHDTSSKIRKQIEWTKDDKDHIWTEIVSEKIKQQALMLQRYQKEEANMLFEYMEEVEFGDITNREGHAAKVYFNTLFGKKFTRTDENPINAALNYGYGIILSIFNREIVSSGYLTQIGLFHDNMFNQFNLSSDLMEPFRPLVDQLVVELKPEKFETEEKRKMLELLNKEVEICGRMEVVTNAIKIYCRSVFDALNDRDISLIRFYYNEL
ncbi:type II CRISPR-associated endonuclease Cas1 [uncultured Eubacterium sp.]|uniref:type II CRISPR-associated endonuclease Cas1 n=1 Tax=uncultured Eubacterium sp. TaxID=165185 RepID=UPI002599ABF4|nr:type II CRISPR-associated endonuclease Cas1 [uncultured Eubacterium sp.]